MQKHRDLIIINLLGMTLLLLVALDLKLLALPRLILGLIFVLFVPGYLLQVVVFPRDSTVSGLERIALSLGLSFAILPFVVLSIDTLRWRIDIHSLTIVGGLSLIAMMLLVWFRRRPLFDEDLFRWTVRFDFLNGWKNQVLFGCMGLGSSIAVIAAALLVIVPGPAQFFTEFYILGSENFAEDYPVIRGENIEIKVVIHNREGTVLNYRIEVWGEDTLMEQTTSFTLKPGERITQTLSFTLPESNYLPVRLVLYRTDQSSPYRSLRFWLNKD